MYNYYLKSTIEAGKGYSRLLTQDGLKSRCNARPNLSQRRTASRISQLFAVFCCLMVMMLLSVEQAQAQTCPNLNCTANDVQIERVFLGDVNGNILTSSCQPGTPQTAYLYLVLSTNAPRTGVFISGTLNGQSLANCFSVPLQGNSTILKYPTPINYTCGTTLTLTDIFVAYNPGKENFCTDNPSGDCSKIVPSKCSRQPPIVVEAPLVANFTAEGSCTPGDEFETFTFTSTTTGGKTPYSFVYNFGDGTPLVTTTNTTITHTYTTGGSKTVTLTVTDAANKTDSETKTITVAACCKFEVTCPADKDLGTFSCTNLGSIPAQPANVAALKAAPYNISIGDKPCGTIRFTSSDNAKPDECSSNDQTITRTITIYDDLDASGDLNGNEPSQTCTFTYKVQADKTNPVLSGVPTDVTVQCNAVPSAATVTAEDNCDTDVEVSYKEEKTAGACANAYTLIRTWTAEDKCGNTSSDSQTITVIDNTKPTFTRPADITIYADADCKYDASTGKTGDVTNEADNCSTGLQATFTDKVETASCGFIIKRTWSLKDACGNMASDQVQTITVTDNIKPVIVPTGTTLTLGCEPTSAQIEAALGTAIATDNCDGNLTPQVSTSSVEGSGCVRYQTRTWTVKDACGNTATTSRKVTWTVPVKADCFKVNLLSVNYSGVNTTFSFRVCGNDCPAALSYIAFIVGKDIRVVSPVNGSTYKGMHTSYKVSVPVSKNVNGVKYESLGEGIKKSCDVFTFTLAGDRRTTPITVQTKAGTKVSNVVVDPGSCICVQNNSPVARQDFSMEESLVEKGISIAAFPNPFYSKATFEFSVGESTEATLELYTVTGLKVATLHKGKLEAGQIYSVDFTPTNLGSGTYIYRLSTATDTRFGRIVFAK